MGLSRMLTAVNFNYQFDLQRCKIKYVVIERMLTPKLYTGYLATTKHSPKSSFRICHGVTKFSLQSAGKNFFVGLADHN